MLTSTKIKIIKNKTKNSDIKKKHRTPSKKPSLTSLMHKTHSCPKASGIYLTLRRCKVVIDKEIAIVQVSDIKKEFSSSSWKRRKQEEETKTRWR